MRVGVLPRTLVGTVFFTDDFAERRGGGPLLFPTLAGALRPDARIHLLASADVGPATVRVLADPSASRPAASACRRTVGARRPRNAPGSHP